MAEVTGRIGADRSRRFRPYPEYRDSGVEWLGEIPAHWDVRRLKTMASVQLSNVDKHTEEGQVPVRLCNYVDVYYSDLVTPEGEFMNATATPNQVRRFLLRAGDVLITKDSESWNDIAVPALVAEDLTDVLCGYHLAQIKPGPDLDGRFLARQFSAIGTRDQFHVAANRITRFGLGGDAIRTGLFPIAPIEEQHAIADFLDRETAKIDALVARKERLIELLQEKRAALITRAVTRGLDPDIPMKDSGVEWLGKIPAHWELTPLKHLLRRCDYGISERLAGAGDIRVLTMAHIQYGEVVLPDEGSINGVDQTMVLEFGDLLFNRTNSRELVGKVGIFRGSQDGDVTFASYLVRLTAREAVEPEWLNYLLNSTGVLGMARSMALLSVNQANLNPTKYQRVIVPIPALSEQQTIAGFLRCETARIDALIAKVRKAIDHLREFRTALISAAVTGKIDVRATSAEATAGQGETR